MTTLPRYREPMCGWPHDAVIKECGCVRTGKHWHLCPPHMAELGADLAHVEGYDT